MRVVTQAWLVLLLKLPLCQPECICTRVSDAWRRSELPLCSKEISVSLLHRLWANSLACDGPSWACESWVQWHWPHKGLFSCLTYLQMAVCSLPVLAFTIISVVHHAAMKRLLTVNPRKQINFCVVCCGAGGERGQLQNWSSLAPPKFITLSKLVPVLYQWLFGHPWGRH